MKPLSHLRRLAAACLWFYPRPWRARYQHEMQDLLTQYPVTLWTVIDVLLGAVDAHLHRHWFPHEVFSMAQQLRTSATTLLVAFALFVIPWVMIPFISDTPATWQSATLQHPEVATALLLFMGAGAAAVVALLIGGIPLVVVSVAQAVRGRRDVGWRLVMPLLLGVVLAAFSLVAQPTWWRRFGLQLPPSALWLKASFFVVALLVLVASTWALTGAVTRSHFSEGLLRFLLLPGLLLGGAMWAAFLAVLVLTILVLMEAPQLAAPGFLLPTFAALVLCACGVASAALGRMLGSTRASMNG